MASGLTVHIDCYGMYEGVQGAAVALILRLWWIELRLVY